MKESDFGLKFLLVERRFGKRSYHYQVINNLTKNKQIKLTQIFNAKLEINKNCRLEKQQQKVKLISYKIIQNKLYKLLHMYI
jgi:hypothetical protein